DRATLASLGFIAAVLAAGLAAWRRAPLVTFAVAWHAISLLPVSQIIPHHELAAEHYLYLPSVGFCLLAGLGFDRLWRAQSRVAVAALVLVMAFFAGRTVLRNFDWRSEKALWAATVATAPRCARAQLNLGMIRAREGRRKEAIERVRIALEIKPHDVYARMALAKLLVLEGDRKSARTELEDALRWAERLKPSPVPPYVVLIALGRHADALPRIQAFLEQHPRKFETWKTLGVCLEALDRPAEALEAWKRFLAARPHDRRAVGKVEALERRIEEESR
ncbi:MAG: tetratricopeptide repeat protein, partial [Planctomycetota bacterium]